MNIIKTKLAFSIATANFKKKKRKLYGVNSEIVKNVTESKRPPAEKYLSLLPGENIKYIS